MKKTLKHRKRKLEAQAETEPEDAFVNALASVRTDTGHFHKAVQARTTVSIQQDIPRRIT